MIDSDNVFFCPGDCELDVEIFVIILESRFIKYRVAQKKRIHSLLINIFGINLKEISTYGGL